jgi:hypothetical protein
LGDGIDYGQRKKKNLGDLIQETLEIMEQNGGDVKILNLYFNLLFRMLLLILNI